MSKFKKILSILMVLAMIISSVSALSSVSVFAEEAAASTDGIVYWDGSTATGITEGSGTKDDPWVIRTGADLAYAVTWNDNGAYATVDNFFVLGNDIYLNELDKINWSTGAVSDGYSAKSWITTQTSFYATLDGNGHTIYGMYYNNSSNHVSLIPKYSGGVVSNIKIDYAYLSGKSVGAFLGYTNWYKNANRKCTFTNCCVGENVTIKGTAETGGFAGRPFTAAYSNVTLTFENCYSLASVTSTGTYGGFWGDQWKQAAGKIKFINCYSLGSFAGRTANSYATHTNCYAEANKAGFSGVTVLTAANMQGLDVFTNAAKMANLNVDDVFVETEGYPILRIFNKEYPIILHETESESEDLFVKDSVKVSDLEIADRAGYTLAGFYADADYTVEIDSNDKAFAYNDIYVKWTANGYDGHYWNGTEVRPTLGDGSEANPFLVYSPEEFAFAVTSYGKIVSNTDNAANMALHFALKNDIYLNDVTGDDWYTKSGLTQWMNSGAKGFVSKFDGRGHVVYGLYYNNPGSGRTALFPNYQGGDIKNLGVEKAYVNCKEASGLVSYMSWAPSGTQNVIDRCYVGEDVIIIGTEYAGGIVSYHSKSITNGKYTISNCYSLADVTCSGSSPAGGICGNQWTVSASSFIIKNCYTNMKVTGKSSDGFMTRTNLYEVNDGTPFSGVTAVTKENMQGKDVFTNPDKMPNLNVDGAFSSTTGYPVLLAFRDDATTITCYITEGKTVEYDVFSDTIAGELAKPTRYGYEFVGYCADADLTQVLDANDTVGCYDTIYTKWELATVEEFSNTYDEEGYEFTVGDMGDTKPDSKGGGYFKGTTANINAKLKDYFSQYDAYVEAGAGVDGSNGMKITHVESFKYKYPTAFILYDAEGNRFTPEANAQYRITLKYKVNVLPESGNETKNLNIVLRSTRSNGNANFGTTLAENPHSNAYELSDGVYQYGIFNDEPIKRGATTDGWITEDLIFTTNSTNPLYIGVVTDQFDSYWATGIDLCIDDITVQTMFIPEGLVEDDVNGDDVVDVLDIIRLKKMATGDSGLAWTGDIDSDYVIASASDLVEFRKLLLNVGSNVPQTKSDRSLVWSDEFDGVEMNTDYWGFRQTMNTGGIYDDTKNHAYVADGNMNLRVTKSVDDYVLARGLTTRGKMSYQYGYLEVRAKLPFSQGAWPSIWMQAYDAKGYVRDNVYNPEIDILEVFSSSDTIRSNIIKHYTDENGGKDEQYDKNKDKMQYTFANAENLSNEYHTYGFEWDETGMKFYVDDVLYNTISFKEDKWETWFGTAYFNDSVNHFKDAFFSLNINNEIFHSDYTSSEEGEWAAEYTIKDGSPLPEYSIDYVRLYQKDGESLSIPALTPTSVTINMYDTAENTYGVTWNTDTKPYASVVQVCEGATFDASKAVEYSADVQKYTSYNTDDSVCEYYVSKAVIKLDPNKTYTYRAFDKILNIGSQIATITTNNANAEKFTFVHVADSQVTEGSVGDLDATGVPFNQTLSGISASGANASFMIHSGDIVEYSKYEAYWDKMLDFNSSYLMSTPLMAVSGNHETTYRNGSDEIFKHFNYNIPEQEDTSKGFFYSFDYGNAKFIMLNTNRLTDNQLTKDQYDWLVNTLKNNTKKWTIVTMHNPLYSIGNYGSEKNTIALALQEQLAGIFAQYNVDLVIQGHDHAYSKTLPITAQGTVDTSYTTEVINGITYDVNPNGTIYAMHGSAGNQGREPNANMDASLYDWYSDGLNNSWAEITVDNDTLTVVVKNVADGTVNTQMSYGIKK